IPAGRREVERFGAQAGSLGCEGLRERRVLAEEERAAKARSEVVAAFPAREAWREHDPRVAVLASHRQDGPACGPVNQLVVERVPWVLEWLAPQREQLAWGAREACVDQQQVAV